MNNPDIGKLILRLTLGILILFHGVHKLLHGIGFIETMVAAHHLPAFFAYGVYIGEVVAPLMLLIGYQTRIGALLIVINMLVALALVHTGQFFSISGTGGYALELQAFYLLSALALIFLGPGRYKAHS
ncbi:DoxX family protein [Mangrovitalea sediminis]|uniref:DoxX family protein n=1 Tax=Mangrovitalea sediminis TaxID=1982043 RepID=UPI000BE4BF83|nr:DoxX family protein [Mangrovitalea sediminis]